MKKILFLLLVGFWFGVQAQTHKLPEPTRQAVSDFASLLNESEREQLARKLFTFRDRTSHQITIVTIPTVWLGNLSIEEYAAELAGTWKPGRRGKDNGLLFLIVGDSGATGLSRVHLESGHGLEGDLPIFLCRQIQAEYVVPHLKKDRYFTALDEGISAVFEAITGEKVERIAQVGTATAATSGKNVGFLLLILGIGGVGAVLFIAVKTFLRISKQKPSVLLPTTPAAASPLTQTILLPSVPAGSDHTGWAIKLPKIGKEDYAGSWEGIGLRLEISLLGNGHFETLKDKKRVQETGFIKFAPDIFYIGTGFSSAEFTIQRPPFQDENGWKMEVNHIELRKVTNAPQKLIELGYGPYCGRWEDDTVLFELAPDGSCRYKSNGWEYKGTIQQLRGRNSH